MIELDIDKSISSRLASLIQAREAAIIGRSGDASTEKEVILFLDRAGSVNFINRFGCKITGTGEPEIVGRNWLELVPSEARANSRSVYERIVDLKMPRQGSFKGSIITASGEDKDICWNYMVLGHGVTLGVILMGSDTNSQELSSAAQIERRYRMITENAGDIIWTVDLENKPTYISPSIERLIGYTAREAMALDMDSVFTPQSVERVKRDFKNQLVLEKKGRSNRDNHHLLELEMVHRNGHTVPVEGSFSFVRDESGEPVEILAVTRDISRRRRFQEQLLMTEHLATIGEMVGGVAGEVKNSLARITGFSEILLNKRPGDEISEEIAIIHHEATKSSQIIKHLMDFTDARKSEKLVPLNLNTVIAAVLNLRCCEHKRSHIQVKTHLDQDIPTVKADRLAMQQVILNLVTNAEYFMLQGRSSGCLEIFTRYEPDKVIIEITNDGPPISSEDHPYIFEPFYTTRPDGKGTGLGLSICRKIIEEHSGRIFADEEYTGGARFIIELPALYSEEKLNTHKGEKF